MTGAIASSGTWPTFTATPLAKRTCRLTCRLTCRQSAAGDGVGAAGAMTCTATKAGAQPQPSPPFEGQNARRVRGICQKNLTGKFGRHEIAAQLRSNFVLMPYSTATHPTNTPDLRHSSISACLASWSYLHRPSRFRPNTNRTHNSAFISVIRVHVDVNGHVASSNQLTNKST